MVRKHIFFSGDVQGVGFRYRSFYIAQSLGLAGWVENLWDGRVEMEVQGDSKDIEMYLYKIKQGDGFIRVDEMEVKPAEVLEENKFMIR